VVDAKGDQTVREMLLQDDRMSNEIEQNSPASDLRVPITARVILPEVLGSLLANGWPGEAPYEYFGSVHDGEKSSSDGRG